MVVGLSLTVVWVSVGLAVGLVGAVLLGAGVVVSGEPGTATPSRAAQENRT